MKDFVKNFLYSASWQKILAAAVLVAVLAAATFLLASCNVARASLSGDRDKTVRDSTHYEIVVEK